MVKSCIWRANSKVTPLDSVVSTHPQNISLSLPTDLKKLRSTGLFYLAIIELNLKQRMDVNKSYSYVGCRRKNIKRPFATKNVCEEADRFRILVQFFQFVHSGEPYSGSSLPNSSPVLSWLSGDDELRSCAGVFQQTSN